MYLCMHVFCMCVCMYMCVYIYVCVYACMYMCIVYICIYKQEPASYMSLVCFNSPKLVRTLSKVGNILNGS